MPKEKFLFGHFSTKKATKLFSNRRYHEEKNYFFSVRYRLHLY